MALVVPLGHETEGPLNKGMVCLVIARINAVNLLYVCTRIPTRVCLFRKGDLLVDLPSQVVVAQEEKQCQPV